MHPSDDAELAEAAELIGSRKITWKMIIIFFLGGLIDMMHFRDADRTHTNQRVEVVWAH